MRNPLSLRRSAAVLAAALATMLLTAGSAAAADPVDTARFLDSEILGPHNSPITGEMVVNNSEWYGIDVLPQLVILGAETSLGDPRLGGPLVRSNNFGCLRYHGADTKWGQLSDGRAWVAGRDWYSFDSPGLGMMAFGRYLKVGLDGFYLRALDGPPYDWPAFASRYYGRNVPGYDRYVRNLYRLERSFRAKAARAGIDW